MKNTVLFSKHLLSTVLATTLVSCGSIAQKADDPITDANIAAIVVGANEIDISAAEIALKRSDNSEIREFATRMIEDHNGVLEAAVSLVAKLGVTPAHHKIVDVLGDQAAEHEANLRSLSGAEFDRAYIDHEVAYHQAVIGVINDTLIPDAQNAELKATLEAVVPAFEAHLAHSEMVASAL